MSEVTALVPKVGSRWVWEIEKPHARALVEVTAVEWNGEECRVWTKVLLSDSYNSKGEVWNELSRFMEAVTPVGGPVSRLTEHRLNGPFSSPPGGDTTGSEET